MATFKCFSCSKTRTEEEMQRCARCKAVWYCSRECQIAHWKVHKPYCKEVADPNVPAMAVIIPCENEKTSALFHTVQLHTTHEIHRIGVLSPVSQLVGLPIVVFRHLVTDPFAMPHNPSLDNRIATHLMIDPDSGFAPPQWQRCVGSVTVLRRDGKPLTVKAIESMWMFCDSLLDDFGSVGDGGHHPKRRMNPAGFQRFCDGYQGSVM